METITVELNFPGALALIVGFAAVVGVAIFALKSGKLSESMLSSGAAMLEGVQSATEALAEATGNPAVSVASFIIKAASQAAHAAEQLCNTGEIGKEQRNAKAKEIAEDLLRMAGIEVTEDRKAAIAVLLEAECDAMGHALELAQSIEIVGDEAVPRFKRESEAEEEN